MATSSRILCGICEGQHLTKSADNWCPECDEALCSDCEKHHRLSKASRNHAIMPIEDYQKLPADISKISHHCEDHGKKFQIVCTHHEELCCPTCISLNYKNCSGLMDLDDVVKTSKTSTMIENLELSIIELRKHIETIITDRQQNLREIEVQRKVFHDKIKQMRKKIDCLLDKLKNMIANELAEAENKIKLQFKSLLLKLEEQSETIGNMQNRIAAIKTHATDLQTFIGCKTLSEQVSKEEKYIESLLENGSLQQINLKCDISDKVSDILTMVTEFGSVSVSYNPPLVLLAKDKDKQAQILTHGSIQSSQSVDQVNVILLKKFELPKGTIKILITGVDISSNQKVIIADYRNTRLIIFNQDGLVTKLIPLSPQSAYDVACIDDSIVAVSFLDHTVIKLVNIVTGTVSRTIETSYVCDGITQRQGKLIYCGREHGIIMYDPNVKTSTTIVKDAINRLNYVTTFNDNIYHTNCDTDTVSCYNTSGEKVWDYKDTSILKTPLAVTVDNYSNVYVASPGTNSVVVISSDGKHGRQILKTDDGMEYPRAVQFNKDRNVLVIACYYDDVMMYNVSYKQ